jgi:hypothetical protein
MNHSMSANRAVVLLTLISVAIRASVFLVYQPVTYPDTGTYFTLAAQLLHFDFREYQGLRTPGYPLLLLLAGQDLLIVWLIQSAMGVLISLLLFWICYSHTGNVAWSLLAGFLHTLALNQLFFEANIVSEAFGTFLVVLSVAGLVSALKSYPQTGYGVATGFVSALVTLTRTVYIYIGPLFAVLLLLFERDSKRLAACLGVAFLLPVLGWAVFNKITINYFGLSTMAGYNLTNHSGGFMEKAGDDYATIRDIYLKYREKKRAETGRHSMTIFIARQEMMEKTGLDEVALSRQLTKLSLELFARYPMLYLKGVAESWASFWAAPNYMVVDKFTVPAAARIVNAIWPVERIFVLIMNFLAIAVSGWVVVHAVWRRLQGTMGLSIPLIVTCVLMGASVLQALAEFGENPRYGIPTQSLALMLVLLAAWDLRAALRARSAAAKP